MTKVIAVTGATGVQGGSVARTMLKTPGWSVRAITRNPNSDAAKALVSEGATVVQADFDDESSLAKAFEGATAIFAVTNFWELLFKSMNQKQSGEEEEKQAMALAKAASNVKTLEHYIWSTLPGAASLTDNKFHVPHLDYKAKVDERIRAELPELAKKTTYLYFGYYPSNMAFFPMCKPFELPSSYGKFIQILPSPGSALVPLAGDMKVNPGLWVRQIIAHPEKSLGKYANVMTEIMSFEDIVKVWSEVTGKQGVYVECSFKDFEKMWGVPGNEMASQFEFGVNVTDWNAAAKGAFVGPEELGITEAIGLKGALEALKDVL